MTIKNVVVVVVTTKKRRTSAENIFMPVLSAALVTHCFLRIENVGMLALMLPDDALGPSECFSAAVALGCGILKCVDLIPRAKAVRAILDSKVAPNAP